MRSKSYLVVAIVLLIGTMLLQNPSWQMNQSVAYAQDSTTSDSTVRSISVSGSGQISVPPDTARIQVGVDTSDVSASAALTANSQQMQSLLAALRDAGIPDEDIQTQVVQLQPQYGDSSMIYPSAAFPPQNGAGQQAPAQGETTQEDVTAEPTLELTVEPTVEGTPEPTAEPTAQPMMPPSTNGSQIVGYVAKNSVEVVTTDLENVGNLLDTVIAAGGNNIIGIRFDVTEANDALSSARDTAWEDAQQKAEQLATLAGAELGQVLTINEFSRGPIPLAESSVLARDAIAVPIQPGSQTIGVDLQVTWELQ